MKKINQWENGYTQGMLVACKDLRDIIEYFEEEKLSKEEMIEILKDTLNCSLETHVVSNGFNVTEWSYDVWVKTNKIITDEVKNKIRDINLVKDEELEVKRT